jgi:hypothetical protein
LACSAWATTIRGSSVDQAEFAHHEEAGAEGGDIAQVAARDDDDVRGLPIELLEDFDPDGLLAFDAE